MKRKKKLAPSKPRRTWTMTDVRRRWSPELLELIEELRHLIRDTVPNVTERVYSQGKAIGYHVPGLGAPLLLWFTEKNAAVVFARGSLMPDPDRLLVGAAKYKSRWVPLKPGQEIPYDALSRLILASLMD